MKCQITLVGGQLLPVYLGVKEFSPEKVFLVVSDQSRSKISSLKSALNGIASVEWNCNAYDFESVKGTCERILDRIDPSDDVTFNLTGGTKIMMLAAHTVLNERRKYGFYINQDNTLLEFPALTVKKLSYELTTKEFFAIGGHVMYSAKVLGDFSDRDMAVARAVDDFAVTEPMKYASITKYFRNLIAKDGVIPAQGNAALSNYVNIKWDTQSLKVFINNNLILNLNSPHIADLFFKAGWWELLVACSVSKWPKVKELLLQFEVAFKSDKDAKKNEIDILINLGHALIFIECKSGIVKQEDINKMRVIKQTYGGVISKSILVSRYLPATTILEKCKELDIEVFSTYAVKGNLINPLPRLLTQLDALERKLFA